MAIPPPPLPDGTPRQQSQQPKQPQPQIIRGSKISTPKKTGSNTWLIVGSVLAGLLLIAAVLLYFLSDLFDSSGSYDYDDGNRNEKVLRQHDDDGTELRKAPERDQEAGSRPAAGAPTALHGRGHNSITPISLDIDIDADGNITGTYWNIFGNLEFSVSGRQTADGSLEMTLTTVKDHVSTPLTLNTTDGFNYSGKWGKKQRPVAIALYDGHSRSSQAPNVISRWHVKGPQPTAVVNDDVCISEENGTYYYWYASQSYDNRLRMTSIPDGFYLYNDKGERIATINGNEDGTATMTDSHGQIFTVTIIE